MFDKTSDTSRESTLTRRSFLRGSALFAAAAVGVAATSRSLFAQDGSTGNAGGNTGDAAPPANPPAAGGETDPSKETKLDSRGIPYRDCPECGGKMYKDDGKTWVCEACGYSYEE